jgi:hypothetical protein
MKLTLHKTDERILRSYTLYKDSIKKLNELAEKYNERKSRILDIAINTLYQKENEHGKNTI